MIHVPEIAPDIINLDSWQDSSPKNDTILTVIKSDILVKNIVSNQIKFYYGDLINSNDYKSDWRFAGIWNDGVLSKSKLQWNYVALYRFDNVNKQAKLIKQVA